MPKSEIKKIAISFGKFFGVVFGLFAILITVILLSRNSWKNGLATEMQKVLDVYSPKTYTVSKYIELNTPISTSSSVYSLIKKGSSSAEKYYGVLIRVPTILGPVPAVFIYKENSSVYFAGFATDTGKASDLINLKTTSSNMKYWESQIPLIIEKSTRK
ncbi:MAG: hypothetical protein KBT11_11060 [Treponema sp.]|nr:hypothetical protein [Candidatus Treponema equifaecale]